MDRGGGAVQGGRGGLSEMWALHVAGSPMASAAEAGRQALGEGSMAGAVQAPVPLPAVPQGVHGARSRVRRQAPDDGEAAADGGEAGKGSDGEVRGAGGGGERRAGGEELAGGACGNLCAIAAPRFPRPGRLLRAAAGAYVGGDVGPGERESGSGGARRAADRRPKDAGAPCIPGERAGRGHRPVAGLPAGGGAGAAGCPDRGRQVPRLSPGRPRPPRSARRDSAARQPSPAPAERGGGAEPAGANTSAAGASGRPSACPCLGPQEGPAGSVQEEAARGGSRGPGALDQGSGGKRPPTLPAHRGYAQEVAEGGPELLAPPDHQRPGGGQAQSSEGPEKEGLRLRERQELSAKNP